MRFVLFEDNLFSNLLPLVYFRPVWELRCGLFTLRERTEKIFGEAAGFLARNYLLDHYHQKPSAAAHISAADELLLLNGRALFEPKHREMVLQLSPGQALKAAGTLLACRLRGTQLLPHLEQGVLRTDLLSAELDIFSVEARSINYPWEAVLGNGELLRSDMQQSGRLGTFAARVYPGVNLVEEKSIFAAAGAAIKPGTVIDAENGPVWIEEGATIMPNAVIEGPAYIGKNTTIKIGAKIYENTTIGPVCKVGGEVEESIFQGYANKQHDGFLGHSFIAPWVNLGADTNNSDLKNNYGDVTAFINGRPVDTGHRFVGLTIGDHSKCAINTMFNTGTVVGACCNIFGAGMPPKFVPSFSWGGAEQLSVFDFEKCVEIAKVVTGRRKVEFNEHSRAIFEAVHELAKSIEHGTLL